MFLENFFKYEKKIFFYLLITYPRNSLSFSYIFSVNDLSKSPATRTSNALLKIPLACKLTVTCLKLSNTNNSGIISKCVFTRVKVVTYSE